MPRNINTNAPTKHASINKSFGHRRLSHRKGARDEPPLELDVVAQQPPVFYSWQKHDHCNTIKLIMPTIPALVHRDAQRADKTQARDGSPSLNISVDTAAQSDKLGTARFFESFARDRLSASALARQPRIMALTDGNATVSKTGTATPVSGPVAGRPPKVANVNTVGQYAAFIALSPLVCASVQYTYILMRAAFTFLSCGSVSTFTSRSSQYYIEVKSLYKT